MPTILHADWSNRPRTAFRRWTQAVHQVAAIQVGRHRFLTCPYRFLAAKRQAKAEIFPRAISTTELPSNPSPLTFRNNQIQILHTRNHGSQCLSARYEHTWDVVVTRAHTRTTRDKGIKKLTVPRRTLVRAAHSRTGGEVNVVLQQQRMVRVLLLLGQLGLASSVTYMCESSLFFCEGRRSVLPFKRHSRHDRVLLEEVCRTMDNTSISVLKMLAESIEAHV